MRFLFITLRAIDSDSSAMIRNRAMITGLLRNGHSVDVLTASISSDATLFPCEGNCTIECLDELSATNHRAPSNTINYRIKAILYKVKKVFTLYDSSKKYVHHKKRIDYGRYDFIVSSSDPKSSHLFVYEHRNEIIALEKKWVQIWGDPFALDITEKNISVTFIKLEEKKLLRFAYKVFYVSPFTLSAQQNQYKEYANKMEYTFVPYLKEQFFHLGGGHELNILYAGDYYSSVRNIIPLVEAIEDSPFHLTVYGNTDLKTNSSNRILIKGRASKAEVEEKEKEADVLVHLSNISGTQVPGKIYQMLGTNKTILFICDGDEGCRNLFRQYDRFVFCENTKEDILEKLKGIHAGKYLSMNRVIQEFSPEIIMKGFVEKVLG